MEQEHGPDGSGELRKEHKNLEKSIWKEVTTVVDVTENSST